MAAGRELQDEVEWLRDIIWQLTGQRFRNRADAGRWLWDRPHAHTRAHSGDGVWVHSQYEEE